MHLREGSLVLQADGGGGDVVGDVARPTHEQAKQVWRVL